MQIVRISMSICICMHIYVYMRVCVYACVCTHLPGHEWLYKLELFGPLCALAAQGGALQSKSKSRAHIPCGRRRLRPALILKLPAT